MKKKNFIRVEENFVCEVCGTKVVGSGYTDHCPNCLFSKHVDEELAGDRSSACHGLMESVGIRHKKGKNQIKYQCIKCGKVFYCKITDNDNQEEIFKLDIGSII